MQRYFAKSKDEKTFVLKDSDLHHIKQVMRMKIGTTIEVVYNSLVYECKINNINPFELEIIKQLETNTELKTKIILGVALVKEQKFDIILQKATELGVTTVVPIIMDRCIVKLSEDKIDKKLQRWNTICKEAAEQSFRNNIPSVCNPIKIKDLPQIESDLKLVCSVNETQKNLKTYLQSKNSYDKILLVIGPEGGISPREEEYLMNNNFNSVSLGNRVLRVETACLYACSVISYEVE